jgi:hypothetical protein
MPRHAFIEALASRENLSSLLLFQAWAIIVNLDKDAAP